MTTVPVTVTSMGFYVPVSVGGLIKGTSLNIWPYAKKFEHRVFDRNIERWVLKEEFFYFDKTQELSYFPRYDLQAFLDFLTTSGYTPVTTYPEGIVGAEASFLMLPHIKHKNDKQKNAIEFLTDEKSGPVRGLGLQTGLGKASVLSANIRTPNGWEKMGDMYIGKEIIAPDGTTTKVVGIYPQGRVPVYRVHFEDGRSTKVTGDHLWRIHYVQWKEKWRVITTDQIKKYLDQPTYAIRMGVQLVKPEIKNDIALPIDPYVLGVILGDGSIKDKTVSICKPQDFVRLEVGRHLPEGYKVGEFRGDGKEFGILIEDGSGRSGFHNLIHDLGLKGTLSHTKFIPEIYMSGSTEQRLSLIQGLMDTDGTVTVSPGRGQTERTPGKGGALEYCTTSLKLAEQVQEIIRSLGGLCRIMTKRPHYTSNYEKREGRLAYYLRIRYQTPRDLFRLPVKRDKTSENYQYAESLRLRVNSVEYVGEEEAQCIMVDHPDHLYITDDYIVTHNTVSHIWGLQITR